METKQLKLMALVICCFFGIQNNFSQNQNNTTKTDIDALFEKYNNNDTPGIAVSVIKDNKVIYQKGFGMANLEYGIPITTKTKFHVASLSKQFTAFMILKLEDEGLLSINDDVKT
jgi:CubicO group peptidase (beta-lactamase class C family)